MVTRPLSPRPLPFLSLKQLRPTVSKMLSELRLFLLRFAVGPDQAASPWSVAALRPPLLEN